MVDGVSGPTQHSGQLSQRFQELRAGRAPRCSRPGGHWQPWNQTRVEGKKLGSQVETHGWASSGLLLYITSLSLSFLTYTWGQVYPLFSLLSYFEIISN